MTAGSRESKKLQSNVETFEGSEVVEIFEVELRLWGGI